MVKWLIYFKHLPRHLRCSVSPVLQAACLANSQIDDCVKGNLVLSVLQLWAGVKHWTSAWGCRNESSPQGPFPLEYAGSLGQFWKACRRGKVSFKTDRTPAYSANGPQGHAFHSPIPGLCFTPAQKLCSLLTQSSIWPAYAIWRYQWAWQKKQNILIDIFIFTVSLLFITRKNLCPIFYTKIIFLKSYLSFKKK